MEKQTQTINEEEFHQIRDEILDKVMKTSHNLIETFEFGILYHLKVSPKQNLKTLAALKEFRKKHWDSRLSRTEAYKKYLESA